MTRDFFRVRPLALICAVYIAASLVCSRLADPLRIGIAAVFAAAGALTAVLISRRVIKISAVIAAALFAVSAAGCVSLAYFGLWRGSVRSYIGSEHEAEAVVTGVESTTSYGGSYVLSVSGIDGRKKRFSALLSLELDTELAVGDHVAFSAGASEPENYSRYFDYAGYNSSRGIEIVFTVTDPSKISITGFGLTGPAGVIRSIRKAVGRVFYRYLGDVPRGMASALFLGDRSGLPQALKRDFTRSGLPHLLALSGMHLAVLASLLSGLLAAVRCPALLRRILLCAAVIFYTALAGAPLSLVRAALMLIITNIGEGLMRRSDPPTSLFLSAALIMTVSPRSVLDIGLLLSFSATLGIVTLGRAIGVSIEARTGRRAGVIFSSLAASASAMLFTLPVIWLAFGRMSLASPLTSLVFSWPVTVITALSAVLVIVSPLPPLAAAVALPLGGLSLAVSDGVSAVGRIRGIMISLGYPFAWIVFAAAAAALAVLVISRRDTLLSAGAVMISAAAVFAVCAGVYEHSMSGVISVVYQPVKKNDVICVMADGGTVVTDISDGSRATRPVFEGIVGEYFRRYDIDVYMLTHWHSKTPSAVSSLLERCSVGTLLLPSPYDDTSSDAAERVENLASKAGVGVRYYPSDSDSTVEIGSLRIDTAALGRIGRSEHPTIALRYGGDGGHIVYAGASAFDSAQYSVLGGWLDGCGALILGAHGPKAAYPPLIGDDSGVGSLIVWDGFGWAGDLAGSGRNVISASDGRPVTARISAK